MTKDIYLQPFSGGNVGIGTTNGNIGIGTWRPEGKLIVLANQDKYFENALNACIMWHSALHWANFILKKLKAGSFYREKLQ